MPTKPQRIQRKRSTDTSCKHTPCPEGYREWHEWAERKLRTHRQIRCPNCGLWAIWVRRKPASQKGESDD